MPIQFPTAQDAELAQPWKKARDTFEVYGSLHVDEGQGHKLSDAPSAGLEGSEGQDVTGPGAGGVAVAKHDGGGGFETNAMRCLHHIQPLLRPQLVWTQLSPHLIIQDLHLPPSLVMLSSCWQRASRFNGMNVL